MVLVRSKMGRSWQELRLVRKEAINFQWQATPGDLDCITSPEWCILAESVTSNFQSQTSQSSRQLRFGQ